MKLVILYGPPASGKLTIATELAKISSVKVFDNHQVIDIIEPIVTREYPNFAELIYTTQRNIIEAAVKANQEDVIITFPYAPNLQRDVDFITDITMNSRALGAEVYSVFLKCDVDTLRKRATEESRKAHGKITTVEIMNQMIEKYDFDKPLDIEGNLVFDTVELSADRVAAEIKTAANL